jgi:ribosomal protein S18 acetylase RimI-like enzyme
VKVELDILFSETMTPSIQEQQELSLLRARCKDKDSFEPGIHVDTALNALKNIKPWLLAKASGEDGTQRIAGAACIFLPTSTQAELSACVDPLFRGQGIFAQLFRRAIVLLREAKVESALLVSDARLSYGQAIAAKLGIKRSHTEKTMNLDLNAGYSYPDYGYAPAIRLVPVTEETVDQASSISASIFNESFEDARAFTLACLANPLREPLLAMGSGGAVGMVSLAHEDEACIIHGLGVVPEQLRQGYGGAIVDTVLTMLKKRGLRKVTLDVDDQNKDAMALYDSRGFSVDSLTEYWRIDLSRLR